MSKYEIGKTYEVNPTDVIVRDDLRGRRKPLPEAKIKELAVDMASQPVGSKQLQPVRCRLTPEGVLELVYGFTRHAAVVWGIENKLNGHPTSLRVEVCSMADSEALAANVRENKQRNDTSPMDDASNIARLKKAGFNGQQIAGMFGKTSSWVSDWSKLNSLSKEHQELVGDGLMGAQDGIAVSKLPKSVQADIVTAATDAESGRVVHDLLVSLINAHADGGSGDDGGDGDEDGEGDEGGGSEESTTTARKQMSPKALKGMLMEYVDGADVPICIGEFFHQIVRVFEGKINERTFQKKVNDLIGNLTQDAKDDTPPASQPAPETNL